MFSKEKAPKSGAFTGNSEDINNKYYTRNTSRKQLQKNKIRANYIIDWAYLVSELPDSGYEEEL